MRKAVLIPLLLAAGLGQAPAQDTEWQRQVASGLGKTGTEMPGGVYRVGLPRTDLKVTLDGVELKPGFAFGSWLAFKRMDNDVVAMGDLVLTDAEINPVMMRLAQAGIEITAVHNHLLRGNPNTMYMHVLGHGESSKLAESFRHALDASGTPFPTAAPATGEPAVALDTNAIDSALGRKGKASGGVYQFSVPRAQPVREHGMDVPEAMGSAIAINFQPTGNGKAAITGDFVLTADEVNPVLRALREHGIEVTALHSHMLGEEPRLFFMHFWANDDAVKLARGLRAALDNAKVSKG
jgi:Domain of Unknown Function (DUF1259)